MRTVYPLAAGMVRNRQHMALACLCAVMVGLSGASGCSFIFTRGGPPPRCSTSVAPPVLDAVFGTLEVARTVAALASSNAHYANAPISRGTDILLGLGFSALFISSAAYGFSTVKECMRRIERSGAIDERQDDLVRSPTTMSSGRFVVRTAIALDELAIQLVGVPNEDPSYVAVRIGRESPTQRWKDCAQFVTTASTRPVTHLASYQARVRGDQIREELVARMHVEELAALAEADDANLAMCDEEARALPLPARAELSSFLKRFNTALTPRARQVARVEGELRLPLVLDGFPIALLGQPAQSADYIFVTFPGLQAVQRGCTSATLVVDTQTSSFPLGKRRGGSQTDFAAVPVELLRQITQATDVNLQVCGYTRQLSVGNKNTITTFLDAFDAQCASLRSGSPAGARAPTSDTPNNESSESPAVVPPAAAPPAAAPPAEASPSTAPVVSPSSVPLPAGSPATQPSSPPPSAPQPP